MDPNTRVEKTLRRHCDYAKVEVTHTTLAGMEADGMFEEAYYVERGETVTVSDGATTATYVLG